jgi:N-acetylmuramoyl-L-alanine amidase
MFWKLRLFWYRLDAAPLAAAVFAAILLAVLAALADQVLRYRDAQRAAVRDFHARSVECLALNVYHEARGEPLAGQYAVAEVTMNRKSSLGYPKSICEVVYQKSAFSWTAQAVGRPAGGEWRRALRIADDVYYQRRSPMLPGVLHYHATYVKPAWSAERKRVARIGRHVFYR